MRRLAGCFGIVGILVTFAAGASHAQLSLPTLSVTDCSVPDVNISTTATSGTLGFDIEVGFGSNVAVDDVFLGDLTADCEYAHNVDGQAVRISIACTEEVTASGSIARIRFVVLSEGMSGLNFNECFANEVPCTSTTSGQLTISGCPSVDLSNGGSGAYGRSPGRACVTGSLAPDGAQVASTQTDIGFASPTLGIETCAINPALTSLGKSLSRTALAAGSERITVSGGTTAIPAGLLFTCRFAIASGQSGSLILTNSSLATNSGGAQLLTAGQNGSIGITSCAGDCDGSGGTDIGEVVKALNAFSGDYICHNSEPVRSCPAADTDNTGGVGIHEVVQSLNQFSAGPCP